MGQAKMANQIKRAHVKWVENYKFAGTSNSGKSIIMDGSADMGGGTAVTPGELIFLALGGCTGIDVVSILNKMRVPFRDLKIEIEGESVDSYPKIYKWVKITYIIIGVADKDKARQAVALSQEKYCSVSAIVRQSTTLTHEIIFED
jgi:putative redox protein